MNLQKSWQGSQKTGKDHFCRSVCNIVPGERQDILRVECKICGHTYATNSNSRIIGHLEGGIKKGVKSCQAVLDAKLSEGDIDQNEYETKSTELKVALSKMCEPSRKRARSSDIRVAESSNFPREQNMNSSEITGLPTHPFSSNSSYSDERCDNAIARFWYSNSLSFRSIDSVEWREVVNQLRKRGPDYKSPSAKEIRGKHLVEQYNSRIKADRAVLLTQAKRFGSTLSFDAWTSCSKVKLMNIVLTCNGSSFFILAKEVTEIYNTDSGVLSAPALKMFLDEILVELKEYNVSYIVCDSPYVHVTLRKMISEDAQIQAEPLSCLMHQINLMFRHLHTWFKPYERVKELKSKLIKFINNRLFFHTLFLKSGGRTAVVHTETKFGSLFYSLKSLNGQRAKLREVLNLEAVTTWAERSNLIKEQKEMIDIVGNDEFWKNLNFCVLFLDPFIALLKVVDSDVPSNGFVLKAMYDIALHAEECEELMECPNLSEKVGRFIESWRSPVLSAGLVLNPMIGFASRKHTLLANDIMGETRTLLIKFCGGRCTEMYKYAADQFHAYLSGAGPFAQYGSNGDVTGIEHDVQAMEKGEPNGSLTKWWENIIWLERSKPFVLKDFALQVLSCNNSAAPCERNWSSFGHVWSNTRNRLKPETAEMVVYIRQSIQLLKQRVNRYEEKYYYSKAEEEF